VVLSLVYLSLTSQRGGSGWRDSRGVRLLASAKITTLYQPGGAPFFPTVTSS
jgi:hypothetical protein